MRRSGHRYEPLSGAFAVGDAFTICNAECIAIRIAIRIAVVLCVGILDCLAFPDPARDRQAHDRADLRPRRGPPVLVFGAEDARQRSPSLLV